MSVIKKERRKFQELIIENNHKNIINMLRSTTAKYAQMIKNLPINFIIDEYDGEVLEESNAQRTCVKCYKKEYPSIFEKQVIFEEETLAHTEGLSIT